MARKNQERDEGYLEVQIDGKQVVIVIVGVLLLCAISFYFGRRVGRAEAARVGDPEALMTTDGGTEQALAEEDAASDLTFFDTVGERPQPSTPPPVVAGEAGSDSEPHQDASRNAGDAAALGSSGAGSSTPPPAVSPPPAAAPAVQPAPTTSAATGRFEVQVGVFSSRPQAESVVRKLRAKGYRPSITPTGDQGKVSYRVRVGGYATRAAAQSAAQRLQSEEGLDTWIPPQGG